MAIESYGSGGLGGGSGGSGALVEVLDGGAVIASTTLLDLDASGGGGGGGKATAATTTGTGTAAETGAAVIGGGYLARAISALQARSGPRLWPLLDGAEARREWAALAALAGAEEPGAPTAGEAGAVSMAPLSVARFSAGAGE